MGLSGRFRNVLASARFRPVPFALGLGLLAAWVRSGRDVDMAAASPNAAIAKALTGRGISSTPDGVVLTAMPGARWLRSMGTTDLAFVRGKPETGEDNHDLHLLLVRRSPEGVVLQIGASYNLTSSTSVDESTPVVSGELVAYTTSLDGVTKAVHVLDLRGHPKASYADFTALQRLQAAGTEWQRTGLSQGIAHDVYGLTQDASGVSLSWAGHVLTARLDDGSEIAIDADARACVKGDRLVRATLGEKGRPAGLVPWAVDRVRAVPAFGDDNMQILKAVAFTALDWAKRGKSSVFGASTGTAEVDNDLGSLQQPAGGAITSTADPEVGFPPAALEPILKPAQPNEGTWISLDRDPFITEVPGLPTPFVQTFLRTDANRTGTRIYVTLWDSRVVALHMEAGTVEPVSATGEAGPGMIPRTPEVIRTVVAGFNGGFQAQHGEYGMQANGILYLPPKPYAATVMELKDGSTAMGSWPGTSDVPDDVLSFRQNLTMLVQDDKWNPWNRTWWGGTPPGWHDTIHTTRSGLCLTKEGFSGYFYGVDISAEELGRAMLRARCRYGMHLDMNGGHAGFEFYSMATQASFQPLGRPLQADWEYEGQVKDMPDFRFRARRMIRSMGHMNFPRYIRRDERDFFYLTARRVLPGPPLDASASPWRVKSLPQHGYPYAIATTTVRTSGASSPLAVLEIDPRAVALKPGAADDPTTVVVFADRGKPRSDGGAGEPSGGAALRLVLTDGQFSIVSREKAGEGVLLEGASTASTDTRAVVGVRDEDGVLLLVEIARDEGKRSEAIAAADALLGRAGASKRMHLAHDTAALLGGGLGLDGERDALPHGPPKARLVRRPMPNGRPYFESTPIVDVSVWRPLQMQRVRYFAKPKPAASVPVPPSP